MQYNIDKPGLENKIDEPDKRIANTSGLVQKKIIMLRSLILKVPSITVFATTTALTAAETKIPSNNNLVKKIVI